MVVLLNIFCIDSLVSGLEGDMIFELCQNDVHLPRRSRPMNHERNARPMYIYRQLWHSVSPTPGIDFAEGPSAEHLKGQRSPLTFQPIANEARAREIAHAGIDQWRRIEAFELDERSLLQFRRASRY